MLQNIIVKLKRILNLFSVDENIVKYIGGGEALPTPYTMEEELEKLEKLEKPEELEDKKIPGGGPGILV